MAQTFSGEDVDHMNVIGNGDTYIYLIHMIEPMVALMGSKAQRLMFTGTELSPAWVIEFEGGRKVNMTLYHNAHSWYFRIQKKDGEVVVIPECNRFFDSFMEQLVDFFKTGNVKVPHEETIAVIEIRTKALEAMEVPYTWLALDC